MIPGKTYTPQDVIDAAWRRRYWIAVPFILLAAASTGWVLSLSRQYQSLATLQAVSDPMADAYVRGASAGHVGDRLSSIQQATLTRSRLETIIRELNLYAEMRQRTVMDNVIENMRADIIFKATDRDLFVLGFTAQQPQLALDVATRLTSLFLEENARDRGKRADATTDFLASQLSEVRQKLDEQERQVEAYKAKYAGELPSQLSYNVQDLNSSQNALRALIDAISRDQDQRLLLEGEQSTLRASGGLVLPGGAEGAGAVVSLVDQIDLARADMVGGGGRLTPQHPDVQRAQRTLAGLLEQQAGGRPTGAAGQATTAADRRRELRMKEIAGQIDVLDRRIASNQAEMGRVRKRIDEYSRRVDIAPLREAEYASLTRDYEDTKKLYSSLLTRQQEATMAANLERKDLGDRFRVIEPAQLPQRPSGQSRTSYLLFALMLAACVSVGIGGLVEYADSTLRSEDDVTVSLKLPVLAAIPDLSARATQRLR